MAATQSEQASSGTQVLKQNAVGVPGIVFCGLAGAGPLCVIVGSPGVVFGLAGNYAAALGFLLAGIVLFLFSVGYAAMSVHISGPGGFGDYIEMAFGRRMGGAAAYTALLGYGGFLVGIMAFFGFLAAPDFKSIGLSLPWWTWTFIAIAVVGLIGYRSIDLSAKVLGVLFSCEIVITLIMDVGILVHGGASGLSLTGFSPAQLFHSSPGVVLLFAVASFVGFETTMLYGEEARNRSRTIPRAAYIVIAAITAFYVISFYLLGVAYGGAVVKVALSSPGTFSFDAANRYVGLWADKTMSWLVLSSVFACVLAFHNGIARYLFALGRAGLVHRRFGVSHARHESPATGSVLTTAATFSIVGICALFGVDPYVHMYALMCGFGTVGMLMLYAGGAAAVIGFLRRRGMDRASLAHIDRACHRHRWPASHGLSLDRQLPLSDWIHEYPLELDLDATVYCSCCRLHCRREEDGRFGPHKRFGRLVW